MNERPFIKGLMYILSPNSRTPLRIAPHHDFRGESINQCVDIFAAALATWKVPVETSKSCAYHALLKVEAAKEIEAPLLQYIFGKGYAGVSGL